MCSNVFSGLRPVVDEAGTPRGFAQWYRRWLDRCDAQLADALLCLRAQAFIEA